MQLESVSATPYHSLFDLGWVNWGDAPTWLGVIVTAGALVAAYMLYRVEIGRDREAGQERQARFEAERRAQANNVAGWFGLLAEAEAPDRAVPIYGAVVKNASDLPVFDLSISFWLPPVGAGGDGEPAHVIGAPLIRVLPPHDEARERMDITVRQGLVGGLDNYLVAIEFRDTAGVRWSRDIYGKLTEVKAA